MRIILLFVICFFIHVSAFSQKQVKLFSDIYDGAIPLKGELVNTELLNSPYYLQIADSFLLVGNNTGKVFVDVLNVNTGKIINQFGYKGRGPGEILYTHSFGQSWDKKTFWAYDIVGRKLNYYDSKKIFAGKKDVYQKTIKLDSVYVASVRQWNNNTFFSTPNYDKNNDRHFLLHKMKSGKLIGAKGKYPMIEQGIPVIFKEAVYNSIFERYPRSNRVVVGHQHWDHITVYDTLFIPKVIIDGPFYINLKYEASSSGTTLLSGGGIVRNLCCGPNGFIYNITEKQRFSDGVYRYLLWLDYEGEMKKIYVLDHKISTFTVDWSKKEVYAVVVQEEEPAIYRYKLE
ncbi:hypothetical protein EMN47_00265 [Prolixibacteraceae bacterium JC049]|nr:hypothetical protein [Prolixibacteraceae bacterium JC049]